MCLTNRKDCTAENGIKNLPGSSLSEVSDPLSLPVSPDANWPVQMRLQRREGYLGASHWSAVKGQAESRGVKPSSIVLSAYAEVLSAWSGSERFDFSVINRSAMTQHNGLSDSQGNTVSLLHVKIDFRQEIPFWKRALGLQQQILQGVSTSDGGGINVSGELSDRRGHVSDVPLTDELESVMLLNPGHKQDAVGPKNPLMIFELRTGEVDDGRLYFSWKLSEECFPPGLIDSMWQAFNGLLSRLADAPVLWESSRLDFTSSVDDAVVYLEGDLPRGVLHDRLDRWASETPYKPVVETATGLMTYQSLGARTNVIASTLRLRGIKQGDLVPVVMDRGAFFVTAVLGILKAGAAFVAVEPSTCREQLHAILENTGARVVLTQTHYALITEWPEAVEVVSVDKLSPVAGKFMPLSIEPDSLAYVLHKTDGSKYPKGIMIDHLGALNTIADINQRFEVGPGDKVFGVSSCSSDRFVYDIFGMLHAGATVVYPEPGYAQNPFHWIEVMSGKGVSLWNSDTAMASLLVEVAGSQGVVLPGLRLFMLSADNVSIELQAQIRRLAPNAVIVRLGGASEASIWSSYDIVQCVDEKQQKRLMGKPLSNQGWLISDAIGRRTPTWTAGELCLIGVGLSPGYWEDEKETRGKFDRGVHGGVRLFRTGRSGRYLPDGSVELLGGAIVQARLVGWERDLIEIKSDLKVTPLAKAVTSGMVPYNEDKQGNNFCIPEKSVSHAFTLLTVLQELQVFLKGQLQQFRKGDEIQNTDNLAIKASKGKTGLRLNSGMQHVNKNVYFRVDGQTNEGEKSCNRPLTKVLSGSGIE